MAEIGYHGTYVRFVTRDQQTAVAFLSLDNAVGDRYTIRTKYENGERSDWIVNAFDQEMGELDHKFSDKLDLNRARGWETVALLSFVAFTEAHDEKPGFYWGEVAVISYDPKHKDGFEGFIEKVSKAMGDGIRPDLRIGPQGLREIVSSKGDYLPTGRQPLPEKKKGTAFVKTERSTNEKLVEQARKGNKGCVVLSWIFFIALIGAIIYGIHCLGLF